MSSRCRPAPISRRTTSSATRTPTGAADPAGGASRASVVTVTYRSAAYLPAFLAALDLQQPRPEVVVVDNAGGDDSAALVRARLPWARLIESPENLGFAGGSNLGARAARGDVLVFLNPDTVPPPDAIAMLAAAAADPAVAVVGCKLLFPDGRIQSAGGVIGARGRCHHRGWNEPDDGRFAEPADVDYVPGAALAVRRALFWQLGGFHAGYFPGFYEDAELCVRARRAGLQVRWLPRPAITHLESPTMGARRAYWMERNRLRFLRRNQPQRGWLRDECAGLLHERVAPLVRAVAGGHPWKARDAARALWPPARALLEAALDRGDAYDDRFRAAPATKRSHSGANTASGA